MVETPRPRPFLSVLEWLCRLIVAGVFVYSAIPKLLDPLSFAKAIDNYRVVFPIIGRGYVNLVAGFMPALELATGLGLLWNRTKRGSALLAAALLLMFTLLIGQAVLRGLNIDCGCFGSGATSKLMARTVGLKAILEDVVWLAMAVYIYLQPDRK
jgi:putative oxidoreductase